MSLKRRLHGFTAEAERTFFRGLGAVESVYKALITDRRWFAVVSAAAEDFWAKKIYYYTGNFTYNAFLAIIALLVAVSALIGILAGSAKLSGEFTKTLENVVPIFGSTPEQTLESLKTYRSVAGVIGVLGLLWTGTRIFGAMEWGFCEIYGSKRRSFAWKRVFGLLLISVIGLLFLAAFLVQFGFTAFWSWVVGDTGALYDVGAFVARPIMGLVVNFFLFLAIYRIVPTVKQTVREVSIGALVSAALFLGMQYLLGFYFSSISKLPSVYGSVSTVIILLIWLHLTGMITFFGAEIIYVAHNEELLEGHRARAERWSFIPRSLRSRIDAAGRTEADDLEP